MTWRKNPKPSILLEIKNVPRSKKITPSALNKKLDKAAKEALNQIEEYQYIAEFKKRSQSLIKMGLAFSGKRFKLLHKKEFMNAKLQKVSRMD